MMTAMSLLLTGSLATLAWSADPDTDPEVAPVPAATPDPEVPPTSEADGDAVAPADAVVEPEPVVQPEPAIVPVAPEAAPVPVDDGRRRVSDPRRAQTVVLAAAGGYDFSTQQGIAGLDIAFHHDGARGFGFEGRLLGAWAFTDARPLGRVELGFVGVVPNQDGLLIRLGLVAGTTVAVAPYPLSFQVGGVPDPASYGNVGFMPYGLIVAELGWQRLDATKGWATWSLGLRAGAGPLLRIGPCDDDPAQSCATPRVAFLGGLTARIRLHNGLHVEATVGPSPMVAVGYAF